MYMHDGACQLLSVKCYHCVSHYYFVHVKTMKDPQPPIVCTDSMQGFIYGGGGHLPPFETQFPP